MTTTAILYYSPRTTTTQGQITMQHGLWSMACLVSMWATVALVVALLVIVFFKANTKPPGMPPGPFSLPIVGNALAILYWGPKVAFRKYAKDYGGILTFRIFGEWAVLVSDPALMRAGLADPEMSGRISSLLFDRKDEIIRGYAHPSPLGIINTSGDVWRNQRRFTLRTLRDLGFGRSSLEPIMQDELQELVQLLRRRQGEKMDVGLLFNRSIVNVLWAITIGKRYSYGDKKLEELVQKMNKMMQTFNPFHPAHRFAWIRKLFPNLSIVKNVEGNLADLLAFIEGEMDVYRQKMVDQVDTGSYIGAYLHEMDKQKPEEEDDAALSMHHLKANIVELFLAGSETTATTLCWAVYLLATNPEAQRAMQDEMDRVVGRDNLPTLAHMDRLTYTMATVYEVQRIGDVLPRGGVHQTTKAVTLGGYHIPKDTTVRFNLSHGLSDPKYWKEPDKFRPEHFLTDDGKLFKPDHYMPFGFGKRMCLGESLARIEVFVFLACLMHRFSWRLSDDPLVWVRGTVVTRPPNFTVYAVSRQEQKAE